MCADIAKFSQLERGRKRLPPFRSKEVFSRDRRAISCQSQSNNCRISQNTSLDTDDPPDTRADTTVYMEFFHENFVCGKVKDKYGRIPIPFRTDRGIPLFRDPHHNTIPCDADRRANPLLKKWEFVKLIHFSI